jgi:hypothetical protein
MTSLLPKISASVFSASNDYVVLTLFQDFSLGPDIRSCPVPLGCSWRRREPVDSVNKAGYPQLLASQ